MQCLKLFGCATIVTIAISAGCAKPSDTTPPPSPAKSAQNSGEPDDHTHGSGPHGGVVFDFGGHHAEFTVDHGKFECTIHILGEDEKTLAPISANEFILSIEETKTADGKVVAPMVVTMKPVDAVGGKASKFIGSDPGMGNVADFSGTLSGQIDDKPALGQFAE